MCSVVLIVGSLCLTDASAAAPPLRPDGQTSVTFVEQWDCCLIYVVFTA